jgi:glycerate kinase
MADGGEGTLDAFETAVAGSVRMPVTVQGPDNRAVDASWLLLPDSAGAAGGTAVIELANTSGITLLDPLLPLDAHTLGFGQAIAAALDHGVHRLLLAIGAQFLDAAGRPIRLGNRGLGQLARVRLEAMRAVPHGGAQILSDVSNPLLGPDGAAAVFGPQKGANPDQVDGIESGLLRLARLLPGGADTPGAGAAGGTGFGLLHWGARLTPGAAAIGEAMGLADAVATAAVVITGEGRFDSQSAAGKVPAYVAGLAAASGAVAMLAAGEIQAPSDDFAAAVSLSEHAASPEAAMAEPERWLRAAGARLAGSLTHSVTR